MRLKLMIAKDLGGLGILEPFRKYMPVLKTI